MSREEAIEVLNGIEEVHGTLPEDGDKIDEALSMAIKALEQEPCGDSISRQAVHKEILVLWNSGGDKDYCMESLRDFVAELPPVKPQEPKTQMVDKSNFDIEQYKMDLQCAYDCGKASVTLANGDRAISLNAVKDILKMANMEEFDIVAYRNIMQLPPVTPQPETGHWIIGRIFPTKITDENLIEYRCSECDRAIRCTESQLVNYPYCHCGTKMVEPQNLKYADNDTMMPAT